MMFKAFSTLQAATKPFIPPKSATEVAADALTAPCAVVARNVEPVNPNANISAVIEPVTLLNFIFSPYC
jgi:hypothetical protein